MFFKWISFNVNLYYKSWNNWNHFSPKLDPLCPSRRPHLSGQKTWRKIGGHWFRQWFPLKSYYFLHQQFLIPTSCTHILLSFNTHIFSFAYSLTHNSPHFFFWKVDNWHHCLWKEKKDVYYWWFWKDINWHHCFRKENKVVYYFWKENK